MLVIGNIKVRKALKIAIPYILLPLVVLFGALAFAGQWAFVALAVATGTLLLFVAGYERRNIGARRLVLCAILTALSVVGRFIPVIKPVTAVTMLAGMYLGSECGFTVGAMSALVSNLFYGQGPWTPFQMLAWGFIGLLAGKIPLLVQSRAAQLVFAAVSAVLFSAIMDVWTVVWYNNTFDISLYMAAFVTALPSTALYCIGNIAFILLLANPIGKKLQRAKLKYDI